MTRDERLDLIDRLRRENVESAAEIARRQAIRDQDPGAEWREHQRMVAERDANSIGSAPMRPPLSPGGLLYRRVETPFPAAPDDGDEPSDGDDEDTLQLFGDWRDKALTDELGGAIVKLRREWRQELERANADLRAENVELKGLVSDALQRFAELRGRVDTLTELLGTKTKLLKP